MGYHHINHLYFFFAGGLVIVNNNGRKGWQKNREDKITERVIKVCSKKCIREINGRIPRLKSTTYLSA